MIDDNDEILNYADKQHLAETKRLKYNKLTNNYKKKNKITKEEEKLTQYNSKTCNYEKFKEYIKVKSEINEKLFESYKDEYFSSSRKRKLKWGAFINARRSEDNLLNKMRLAAEKKNMVKI